MKLHLPLAVVTLTALSLAIAGCEKKPQGFALDGSSIRYETKKFEEPETLAEVQGKKFTKSQILDKSPVIKDLDQQEREAVIGLAYLKVAPPAESATKGDVEIFLPELETPLEKMLLKFDRQPTPGVGIVYKPAESPNLVARFKGQNVTFDDIDRNHIVLQSIEQRRFREVASQLNGQLSRILLNEVASGKGMSLQDFIAKEVLKGGVTVSDQELSSYLKQIGFAESEMTAELRPRFIEGIKVRKENALMEDYVAKNVLKGPIAVAFNAPRADLKLNEDWKPVRGYDDAPVALVAFSGVVCNDCPKFIETLDTLMKEHDGYLKLNWIHYFNPDDGIARMVAEASLCVGGLDRKKTLPFIKSIAAAGSNIDEKSFYEWVGKNGMSEADFKSCFLERKQKELVDQHLDYAKRVGVVSNPTLWADGRTMQGVISVEESDRVVNEKISESGSTWIQALVRRVKGWLGKS